LWLEDRAEDLSDNIIEWLTPPSELVEYMIMGDRVTHVYAIAAYPSTILIIHRDDPSLLLLLINTDYAKATFGLVANLVPHVFTDDWFEIIG
jgi:hypothetical protein